MQARQVQLSAAVAVGEVRDRAQIVLDGLYAQTAASSMEIVVVDTCAHLPPLRLQPEVIPTRYLRSPARQNWGEARASAVRAACGELVAFTEDHCLPRADWAEALLRASTRPWAAAGYTFTNGNPGSYCSWAGFVADYLEWAHPIPNGVTRMPCNNVVYRRSELLDLGDRLDDMLRTDVTVCEYLRRKGKTCEIVTDAVVAHQNHESLGPLMDANFAHCRLIAAGRVQQGGWGWPRRLAYALAVPVLVPFMKLWWILRVQRRRTTLWGRTVTALPIAIMVFVWSSIGESLGYLFGAGSALERFKTAEVSIPRSARLGP